MSDSYIIYDKGGQAVSFVGPDAVQLFRAASLASGLKLYAKTKIKPNRAWTPTAMLCAAAEITLKTYSRGEYLQAAADLTIWVNEMRAALPQEEQK
jgi:hypothetical protein